MEDLKMKFQQTNLSKRIFLFLILLFIVLMSASVTQAGNYTYSTKWGSQGKGDGQFNSPHGVAVDSSGYVYVTDTENHRVQKFSSSDGINYNFVSYVGDQNSAIECSSGSDIGQFNAPYGVAVDYLGYVYVADNKNNRLQVFDNDTGKYINQGFQKGYKLGPKGIAIDNRKSSNVYAYLTSDIYPIMKFLETGAASAYSSAWLWLSTYNLNGFSSPEGIAVDSLYNVYVADTGNNHIEKFSSSDGITYTSKAVIGHNGTDDGGLQGPSGVAVDLLGNVYVADTQNNRVQMFSSSDGINYKFVSYVGDKDSAETCSSGQGDGQFSHPTGVAVDSSGYVYVADTGNDRVQKFKHKIIPKIIWRPAKYEVDYGTPLDSTHLNAYAIVPKSIFIKRIPGTFIYTPEIGTNLYSSRTLYVYFKPDDNKKYDTASKDIYMRVKEKHVLIAHFTTTSTNPDSLTVRFIDGTLGNPIWWDWNFGDGTKHSRDRNPVHRYAHGGDYTVILHVGDAYGTSWRVRDIKVGRTHIDPYPKIIKNLIPKMNGGFVNQTIEG
jgi:sugar lactone lactonase YvrE